MRETIGRKKSTNRGSWYTILQNDIRTGTVNNKRTSIPILFLQSNIINWGTTTRWVLWNFWNLASNSKPRAVYVAAEETPKRILSPVFYTLNQCVVTNKVRLYHHHDVSHGSTTSDLSTTSFTKVTNCNVLWPLITSPKLLPLDRPSIPASIIQVPWLWIMCSTRPPFIFTWC